MDIKEYKRQYYLNNKKRLNEKSKQWYLDNLDKKKSYDKIYRQENKDKYKKQSEIWHKDNPEKTKEIAKKYRQTHKEEIKKRRKEKYKEHINQERKDSREQYENNPEYFHQYYLKHKIKIRKYTNHKRKTDLKYALNHNFSNEIRMALKGNKDGYHWESLVGYTLNNLINRLKSTMPEGYAWQDYLEGKLQIDHIIPISVFNYTKSEHIDFKRCWSLNNLQLLPARKNIQKYNHLDKPFQPALCLEY